MHFQFDYFCSVATYDLIFGVVWYIIKHSMKQPDLYYFETIIKVHREYSPVARILYTKFD